MYGKWFAKAYQGSMYGAGLEVFAVWPWVIANADRKGYVEINPKRVASELGCTPEDIQTALAYLEAPDPGSRSSTEDGRRIVREGAFLFRIVTYEDHRKILNADDQRESARKRKRKQREREKEMSHRESQMSRHAEADAKAEANAEANADGDSRGRMERETEALARHATLSQAINPDPRRNVTREYHSAIEATGSWFRCLNLDRWVITLGESIADLDLTPEKVQRVLEYHDAHPKDAPDRREIWYGRHRSWLRKAVGGGIDWSSL
jgi:hypothetical protein